MLLIGFVWVFIGIAALVLAKPFSPGKWEDTGPAAMMAACLGAFVCGSIAVLAVEGPDGYGPPAISGTALGITASIIGGAIGFGAFIGDQRRQARVG